jgi:hypothetical protein
VRLPEGMAWHQLRPGVNLLKPFFYLAGTDASTVVRIIAKRQNNFCDKTYPYHSTVVKVRLRDKLLKYYEFIFLTLSNYKKHFYFKSFRLLTVF